MAVWANEGKDVLVSYNYMLRVEGVYDLPCKAVHSFTKENEFEYVQEGGLNDYVHMLRKPVSKPFTFTVERYVGTDDFPVLPLGAELILPVILMVTPHPNRFDISKKTFVFTGCTVMSKTFGELNAEKSGILTESIVIGYREMLEVTLPVHIGADAQKWAFDGKKVEGNGVKSAVVYERPAEAEKAIRRAWNTSGDTVTTGEGKDAVTKSILGGGTASAKKAPDSKPEKRYWNINEYIEDKAKPPVTDGQTGVANNKARSHQSAHTNPRSAELDKAELRRWNIAGDTVTVGEGENAVTKGVLGGGKTSARQAPNTKAESRAWTMDGGTASAIQSPVTEAEGRAWTMEGGTASAKQTPVSEAEGRAWTMEGGTASAKQAPNSKPAGRKWPEVSSAKRYEDSKK